MAIQSRALYCPPDVDEAYRQWKASCGPCAVAAILGCRLFNVRPLFPGFERRGYANPTTIREALTAARVDWRTVSGMPRRGLAFLQITGPWDAPGVPVAAAYRKTHWVAVKLLSDGTDSGESDDWVYDCNAGAEDGSRGDWWPSAEWERHVMSAIVAGHKGATGWRVRLGIEVGDAEKP